jgi:hypothetical protein
MLYVVCRVGVFVGALQAIMTVVMVRISIINTGDMGISFFILTGNRNTFYVIC